MSAQIISGLLIGAVVAAVGALLNYLSGVSRDEKRWDREDKFRDYQERRLAYKTFARYADLMFSGEDRERWEDLQSRTLYDAYRESVNDVRLAAPPKVWEAADQLDYGSVGKLVIDGNRGVDAMLRRLEKVVKQCLYVASEFQTAAD